MTQQFDYIGALVKYVGIGQFASKPKVFMDQISDEVLDSPAESSLSSLDVNFGGKY